jgi:arylsulfatase A-like enzyme
MFGMRLFGFLMLLLFFIAGCGTTAENREEQRRPNILFAIADDASYPHMGAYGTDWVTTPAFDRVAREGLLFERAYTPNAKCAPSRSCILTGRNSWQLEEAANHSPFFPDKFTTFVEVLGRHGYKTGFTGKGWSPGDPGTRSGEPRKLVGPGYWGQSIEPPTSKMSPVDYAGNFAGFLDKRASDDKSAPFFFWYGSTEPHREYEYGSGLRLTNRQLEDIDQVPGMWPDTDTIRTDILDYALEIDYFDRHLADMIAELERRGELDNTLVVVTSDNGMPFPRIKGQAYELSNHLPLAIMWADGIERPGRRVEDFVNFIDFAPTFLDLAGIDWSSSGMEPTVGKSMQPLLSDEKLEEPFRDHILIGKERHDIGRPGDKGYPIRGIVRGDLLYLHNYETDRWPVGNPETGYLNTDGSPTKSQILNLRRNGTDTAGYWQLNFGKRPAEEFYNIEQDPYCLTNLIDDPNFEGQIASMREQMTSELRDQQDPRVVGNGETFDDYPYAGAVRGYYKRYQSGERTPASWVAPTDYEPQPLD